MADRRTVGYATVQKIEVILSDDAEVCNSRATAVYRYN